MPVHLQLDKNEDKSEILNGNVSENLEVSTKIEKAIFI